jgi:protein-L-isoaspartate(D-aspartate) O-methyltransferase
VNTLRDTNIGTADEAAQADALREAMITELRELKAIRSDPVTDAFRTVPRHLFAPGEPLERVYAADSAVVTKRDKHGVAVSLVSSAHIQTTMLEQVQLEAGMRVLEIGSGGYNAALIAELVGETGSSPRSTSTPTWLTVPGAAWRQPVTPERTWWWRTRRAVYRTMLPTTG